MQGSTAVPSSPACWQLLHQHCMCMFIVRTPCLFCETKQQLEMHLACQARLKEVHPVLNRLEAKRPELLRPVCNHCAAPTSWYAIHLPPAILPTLRIPAHYILPALWHLPPVPANCATRVHCTLDTNVDQASSQAVKYRVGTCSDLHYRRVAERPALSLALAIGPRA
jgi:hypothetical protein